MKEERCHQSTRQVQAIDKNCCVVHIITLELTSVRIVTVWCACRKARAEVFISAIAVGVTLLITGLIALYVKQPYHIWYSFLLPGFITTIVFGGLFPIVRKRFIESEMIKMQAKDL